MAELIETAEMAAFARIVEARSLSRAAAELAVPRATVSRRLARLEQRLGVRLLRRTTRALALTDAGEAFYRHARLALDAVRQAEASVRTDASVVRGSLRVAVPPTNDPRFLAMLCSFMQRFPDVKLHLHFSSEHVDLRRDGFDAALRAGTEIEQDLVARTLARAPVIAVASPAYLARHGVPRTARDLRLHRCLLGYARGEVPQTYWPLARGGKLRVEGVLVTNELTLLRQAALDGLGIALLPELMVASKLEKNTLVRVLPGIVEADSSVAIVYPDREFVPAQVRAFVDTVLEWSPQEFGKRRVSAKPGRSRKRGS